MNSTFPGSKWCLATCLILLPFIASAQILPANGKISEDTIISPINRIMTDVFILNTKDPLQVSLRRRYDNDSITTYKEYGKGKLEVKSNRLSSFKIECINPLRYKYYINSELVTQFVESDLQTLSLLSRSGTFLTPSDIEIPEIFKETIDKNGKREGLALLQASIKIHKDSVEKYDEKWQELYLKYNQWFRYDSNMQLLGQTDKEKVESGKIKLKMQEVSQKQSIWIKKTNMLLDEYEKKMGLLPINSEALPTLKKYKNISLDNDAILSEIKSIQKMMKDFANEYDTLSSDFNQIFKLLNRKRQILNTSRFNTTNPNTQDNSELDGLLLKYGYISKQKNYSFSQPVLPGADLNDNRQEEIEIKEYLLNKRYQVFESFVLNISTEIGVLLQSRFRQLSQNYNLLRKQNYLDKKDLNSINIQKRQLIEIFDFVNTTSAEFRILSSYLDIDNTTYTSVAKGINTNYKSLLIYMKNLDLLEEGNTVEYTLPSTTNYRNIDLIRYKIEREDLVTENKQTYVYDFWLKGGLKVDFSVGILASGLVDNSYEKTKAITDNSIVIKRKDTGKYNFAFGGMVNLTPRTGASWVSGGVSLGIAYSTNQKLQFLSGLSLHLGKTERISLHGGVGFGFIDTFDTSVNEFTNMEGDDFKVQVTSFDEYNIPLVSKFTAKPFFGISYNLSKKNALQAVSDGGLTKYNSFQDKTKTVSPE
jgi:hypothetical protein